MMSENNLVKGILIGVGVSAVGFYLYKKNEEKVDSFLRGRGMESNRVDQTMKPCLSKN